MTAFKPHWLSGLALGLALTVGGPLTAAAADSKSVVKIGYAVSKTGPNAGGANTTTLPNYQLWVAQVNQAGGLQVGDRRLPIEVVEYDDRSSSEEAVRAVERLITQDKVDFLLPPWGTAVNLAVGPIFHRHGYPQLAGSAVTDRATEFAKRWPNSYWLLGTGASYAQEIVNLMAQLEREGKIGKRVAMASIADGFGIELSNAGRNALKQAGFELVYDRSYPIGTQDFAPIVTEIKNLNPDVFITFSYPPDTIAVTEQARLLSFNPKLMYTGVGTAFPLFKNRFANNAQGMVSLGGITSDSAAVKDYIARHVEVTGKEPDRWASLVTYAGLQVLQQAIEKAGTLDRKQVNQAIAEGSFNTVLGQVKLEGNVMPNVWKVGQWQNGEFVGLAPTDRAGASTLVFPKPEWQAPAK